MTRLSDDCFAGDDAVLRLDEAAARLAGSLTARVGTGTVPLAEADGRVLAADIHAPLPLPPFDNAAVDGYAFRHADLAGGADGTARLPLRGRILAGSAEAETVAGTACRIFTGAPMPAGADTVAMQEDVRREGDAVLIPARIARGANWRRAGEDVALGARALPAGRRLAPEDLALLAALGVAAVPVRERPRIAVFSTGDEVGDPGDARGPAGIYDANRPMLLALLRRLGAAVTDLGILRDDPALLRGRLRAAADGADLILTSGGVSVGEADHVRHVVSEAGSLGFWRLAIKPGKPVTVGRLGEAAFVGLPGNPVAAYVTFAFVVRPLLARLSGAEDLPLSGIPVRAAFAHAKKPGRREFLRVRLRRDAQGRVEAARAPGGALSGLAGSDGLADLAEEVTHLEPGETVVVHPHALLR